MFFANQFKKMPKWLPAVAIIFFIAILAGTSVGIVFEKKYKNKIYPGVNINGITLGGKTYEEAKELVNQKINKISQEGITFNGNDHSIVLYPVISSVESDLAYEIITFGTEETINRALAFGRENNFLLNFFRRIKAAVFTKKINLTIAINKAEAIKLLRENFSQYENPAQDAKLIAKSTGTKTDFEVEKEQLGKIFNYEYGLAELENKLIVLDNSAIHLTMQTDYPKIYQNETLNVGIKAEKLLEAAPLKLKLEENEWVINKEKLADWMTLKINPGQTNNNGEKIIVGLNNEKLKNFLEEEVSPQINKEPIDAKFNIDNGRVTEFQASQDGRMLDIEANLAKVDYEFSEKNINEIELAIKETKSSISTDDVNDLGITEIIGTGTSNFAGSPPNRRHNIAVGAGTLNGILIKPEEEFSLLNALGEIDAEAGYLPELVIKNNRTIPEYGGGLCQIGTTTFRTALASGLPVTMRRNHSYRVSYYEPAGTDATIYNPWPDFKFANDTGHYVLIQTRIEGDDLYFDFWGTKDGRQVEKTDPIIYNITSPGPAQLIETLDLAPGVKKCTERAHNGADAYFDYKVTYSGGEIKEERFNSHYVPWREVCLIGVEKLSEDKPDEGKQNDKTAEGEPSTLN